MNSAIKLFLSAINDKCALFEVKLWNLIRDEFDLYSEIDEFRRAHLAPIKSRQEGHEGVGALSSKHTRRRSRGKPTLLERQSSGNLTTNMASEFLGLQNRLQKCELHLWSLLDEKQAVQSSIQDMQLENNRIEIKVDDSDDGHDPAASIECDLPIENAKKKTKKSKRKIGGSSFECDICARKFGYKDHLRQHMEQRHGSCESNPYPLSTHPST